MHENWPPRYFIIPNVLRCWLLWYAKYSSLTLDSLVTEIHIRLPLLGKGQCIIRFSEKTGVFFSCADLVSSSKYRETADMYSEFGPNINEEPGLESNEGAPPPVPKRSQRVKFDGEPLARKASIESTHSKGYYYNSNIARFNV